LAWLLVVGGSALAQPPEGNIDVSGRDEGYVATLSGAGGASATSGRIGVYVPAGAMSTAELQELADSLSRGFDALVELTHSPRSWQRLPSRVSYYFHAEMWISHADQENDRVFIAFPRLQSGVAPLLHEAAHVLLYANAEYVAAHPELFDESGDALSIWLIEGLASYAGESAAKLTGVHEGDPLGSGTLDEVDAKCAAAASTPVGAEVLPYVGAPGSPEALLSRARRLEVARPFYACATSFTKFLVGAAGIDAVVDALYARDPEAAIAAAAGKSIESLRADWRKAIGAN
jgi:hypothetical protein